MSTLHDLIGSSLRPSRNRLENLSPDVCTRKRLEKWSKILFSLSSKSSYCSSVEIVYSIRFWNFFQLSHHQVFNYSSVESTIQVFDYLPSSVYSHRHIGSSTSMMLTLTLTSANIRVVDFLSKKSNIRIENLIVE